MNKTESPKVDAEKIRKATQDAVKRYADIQHEVHDITITALQDGHLETARVKEIIKAVSEGATEGASEFGENIHEAMKQAFTGLDQALAKAAEASKLAIQEAVGHADDFSQNELKRSLDDLDTLEELFLDTLKKTGKSASGSAAEILEDLVLHARHSGTAVGEHISRSVKGLHEQMERAGMLGLKAGTEFAVSASQQIAQIASGILSGIADSLQGVDQKTKRNNLYCF